MNSYEQLLEKALSSMPETVKKSERFEIPKAEGHFQGNKTIITNFSPLVSTLRCDSQHFLKFLLKELATPGTVDGPRLVLGRKVASSMVNAKIAKYAELYVLCNTCGKPDTNIIEKEGKTYLKCSACGAQQVIKL